MAEQKGLRPGNAVIPTLTVAKTMEILRTTVERLDQLDLAPKRVLRAVTEYGWSVNDQLAHLRACHDVLGGNMHRIVREDHPSWPGMSPRAWQKKTDYFEWEWAPALRAFREQRAELLEVLEPLPIEAWGRTASVTAPPRMVYEYSVLYYGDWMARHERSHLHHMAKIVDDLAAS